MAEMMTSSELRELNNERQTGQSAEDITPIPQTPKMKNYGYGSVGNAIIQNLQSGNIDNGTRSYNREAAEAGWGTSQYDRSNWYAPGMDLEEARALEQSGFAKIGNGLIKGGITAAATATNTVAGTALGLGKFFWQYMPIINKANPEGVPSFMEALDASVNNDISRWTVDLQKKSDEWFPNYRTEAERSEEYQKEWYKHMGTANFIGDSFLKNFGFTVGAMGGGMVWSKLLGNALSKKLAGDILKGSVIAAEGDAEANATLQRVAEAVKNGTVEAMDANKLAVSIEEAARRINKADALLQIYGATIGAMGEGNMEGLMAKQEFLDDYLQNLNENFIQDYKDAEAQVIQEGKEQGNKWVTYVIGTREDGTVGPVPVLTKAGKMQVEERRYNLQKDLEKNRQQAEIEGDRLASTTFLLNLPILTTSNLVQFGRMFSGGWKTARGNAAKVKGKVGTELPKNIKGEYAAPKFTGEYKSGAGSLGWNSVLNTLKVMGSESFEEMAQGTVSSGAKNVASENMASFNNEGYDPASVNQVREWFSNMYEGGAEYLSDVKNWQEGALGAITGLFGIPGKVWKSGQRWNGGIYGAVKDARERVQSSEATAEKLNTLVNSKEFQDRWHGYIRHLSYDAKMQDAVANDDQYAWHDANDAQLINDVIMFADAGKLEDLSQIIDAYSSLSVADANSLKEAMKDDKSDQVTNPGRDIRNMNPEEIVSKVKEQATDIKKTIEQYKNVYEALSARAPIGTSPELLKELVFTTMQIKNYEGRFLQMLNETLEQIDPILELRASYRQNGELINDAGEKKQRLLEMRGLYENIYGKVTVPVKMPKYVEEAVNKQLDVLEELSQGDDELQKKVKDMRKLADDRKSYYKKLSTLQGEAAERTFQEQAITQDKVDDAAIAAMSYIETEGLDTPEAVKKAYLEKNAKDRVAFLRTLSAVESKNPAIKRFMDMKRRHDGFRAYVEKNGFEVNNVAVTPTMLFSATNDLLRYAKSEQDIINLPDSMFMSLDEFKNTFSGLIPVSDGVYDSLRQSMRNTMQKYLASEGLTNSRNAVNPNPVQTSTSGTNTPTGYDASQPGSVAPAPTATTAQNPQPSPVASAPIPAERTGEETPVAVQEGLTPMSDKGTPDELAQDATQAEGQAEVAGEDKLIDNQIPYYRTSVPEISTEQATKVREGELDRKDADFEDFTSYLQNAGNLSKADERLKNSPDFEATWNALKDAGAFENVAELVSVGDEVEFVVDPAFPKYNDQYQILVCTNKDGQKKILTVLSGQNSKYLGLSKLRGEIDSAYRQFIDGHPNEVFVFDKKSQVWAKRAGQIDYDYTGQEEKGIKNIPAYSESAPIVFINRNGEPQVIRGNQNVLSQTTENTFTEDFNSKRKGTLYYLSPNGDDAYVPIRLYVEHFTKENANSTNPLFVKVRGLISSIAEQTSKTNKVGTNFEEENAKLRDKISSLVKLLDLHDLYLELGNYTNIGPALKIVTWVKQDDGTRKEEHSYRTADQITSDWLIDKIADLGVSFQIRQKEEGGTLENLEEFIDNDILTSNARMFRPKGVDFYFNAWDDESQSFKPMTSEQVSAVEKIKQPEVPVTQLPGSSPIPAGLESAVIHRSNRDEDDWFGDDAAPEPTKPTQKPLEPLPGTHPNPQPERQTWSEVDPRITEYLTEQGWTEEEFNNASPEEQEKAVRCAGF